MELLAFTHAAVSYEDPGPEPELRSPEEILSTIPQSVWVGAASIAVCSAILTTSPQAAHAALCVRGDSGPLVSDIQRSLTDRGFDPGGVDGVFGVGTEAAVIDFQIANNIPADGRVGNLTLDFLGLADSTNAPGTQCGSGGTGNVGGGSGTAVVTASSLNVRTAPSSSSGSRGLVFSGETIRFSGIATGEAVRGDTRWLFLPNVNGYVAATFTTAGSGGTGEVIGGSGSATITASSGLNVRTSPNSSSSSRGVVSNGQTVRFSEIVRGESVRGDNRWLFLPAVNGYVAASFTTIGGGTDVGDPSTGTATGTASALIVRPGPSQGSGDTGETIFAGESFFFNGIARGQSVAGDDRWLFVPSRGGYVAAAFTTIGGGSGGSGGTGGVNVVGPVIEEGIFSVVVEASALTIRAGTNTASAPIGTLSAGQRVTVSVVHQGEFVGGSDRWLRLQGAGGGFIAAGFTSYSGFTGGSSVAFAN